MLKTISFLFFILGGICAQAQQVDPQGYVDFGMVEKVIVNGAHVGGSNAVLSDIIPRVYSVQRTKKGSETADCAGVLIATDVVLTAAHCLGEDQSPFSVSVQFGKYAYMVSSVVRHPRFSGVSFLPFGKGHQLSGFHDIALIFLQRHVLGAKPALLPPPRSVLPPHATLMLTGFGKTSKKGSKSKSLLWVEVPATEGTQSRIVVKSAKISCKGDSGAPALERKEARFVVRGVTSAGDCETYAYYTRVSDYVDWILSEIEKFRSEEEI